MSSIHFSIAAATSHEPRRLEHLRSLDEERDNTMPSADPEAKRRAARDTVDILFEISTILVRSSPVLYGFREAGKATNKSS